MSCATFAEGSQNAIITPAVLARTRFLVVCAVGFVSLSCDRSTISERQQQERVETCVQYLARKTRGDARFDELILARNPKEHGAVIIAGLVPEKEGLSVLTNLVNQLPYKVRVIWSVRVAQKGK